MSTQKSNIEKFEDFELTPENAQKVEGGKGGKVKTCMTIEVKRCLTVEGGWCPGGYAGDGWEVDSERCPWAKDADVQ